MLGIAIAAGALAANAISGIYNAHANRKAQSAAEKGAGQAADTISGGWDSVQASHDSVNDMLENYAKTIKATYADKDAVGKEYSDTLLNGSMDYTPTDYSYGKSVEDFYDPAWQVNNNAQMRALENSAANAGHGFSSGLAQNMAGTTSANATNAYKEAREAYYSDKSLYNDQWKSENSNLQQSANIANQKAQTLGDYITGFNDAYSNYTNAKVANQNSLSSDYTNALAAYANQVANANGKQSKNFDTSINTYTTSLI